MVASHFNDAKSEPWSAPVPGRSHVDMQRDARIFPRCKPDAAAAAEDGRTPKCPSYSSVSEFGLVTAIALRFLFEMERKRFPGPPHNPGVRDLVDSKRLGSRPLTKDEMKRGFLGWHENGYLPHRDEPGLIQFVTFRLADAFPAEMRSEWEGLLQIEEARERRIQLEAYLDRGRGTCHLRRADLAAAVESSLLFRHSVEYELRAWVIMPNHVHLLFVVLDVPMGQLVDAWKGYTAKIANKTLGRTGSFWQEGYWDTYMRDGEHESKACRYIENNPTKAKLVASPKEWPWSSARFRDGYERLCLPPSAPLPGRGT